MNDNMKKTPALLKQEAKSIIAHSGGKVLTTALLVVLTQFVLSMLTAELSGYSEYIVSYYNMLMSGEFYVVAWPTVKVTAAILCVVISLMSMMLNLGYTWYALRTVRGEICGFRDIFEIFGSFGKLFLIQILRSLLVAVGLVFFIVPGIILYFKYSMAVYIAYDEPELGAIGCMRRSSEIMRGKKMDFFKLELSFILWYIINELLAMVLAPILNIWILPYTEITFALFYIYNSDATGGFDRKVEPEV